MDKKSDTEGVPGPAIDASMTARHWWREDGSMLLPGEKGGSTVFEISFWDGCRYVGHTETTVFECADDLVASPWDERRSRFVAEHCARMGSMVRCIASDLEVVAAAELRDELVANGPDGLRKVDEASLEARDCFLAEVPVEPVRMSFADWVKTMEEGEPGGSVSYGFMLTDILPPQSSNPGRSCGPSRARRGSGADLPAAVLNPGAQCP